MSLSQQVQDHLDFIDSEILHDSSAEERKELDEIKRVVNLIVDEVIDSRETFTDGKLASIEKLVDQMPEAIESFLDDHYTRKLVSAVPGYVRRTLELSRLEGSRVPSKTTNSYLREAVRTYIFGFPQASIALSRAALEQALKEELGHQGRETFLKMEQLLDEAEGARIIDSVIRQTAREVADEADAVLHEKPSELIKAYNCLLKLRGVLTHVYRD